VDPGVIEREAEKPIVHSVCQVQQGAESREQWDQDMK